MPTPECPLSPKTATRAGGREMENMMEEEVNVD